MRKKEFVVLMAVILTIVFSSGSAFSASRNKDTAIVVYPSREYAEILRQLTSLQNQIDKLKESEKLNQSGNDLSSVRTLEQLNREREMKRIEDSINERISALSATVQGNLGGTQRDTDKFERSREESRRDADMMERGQGEIRSSLTYLRERIESSKLFSTVFNLVIIFLLLMLGSGLLFGFLSLRNTRQARSESGRRSQDQKRNGESIMVMNYVDREENDAREKERMRRDISEKQQVINSQTMEITRQKSILDSKNAKIADLEGELQKKEVVLDIKNSETSKLEADLLRRESDIVGLNQNVDRLTKEKLSLFEILRGERVEVMIEGYGQVIFYPPYIVDKENGREGFATLSLDEFGKIRLWPKLSNVADSVENTIRTYLLQKTGDADAIAAVTKLVERFQNENRLFLPKKVC